jgi:hypothetical protein
LLGRRADVGNAEREIDLAPGEAGEFAKAQTGVLQKPYDAPLAPSAAGAA